LRKLLGDGGLFRNRGCGLQKHDTEVGSAARQDSGNRFRSRPSMSLHISAAPFAVAICALTFGSAAVSASIWLCCD